MRIPVRQPLSRQPERVDRAAVRELPRHHEQPGAVAARGRGSRARRPGRRSRGRCCSRAWTPKSRRGRGCRCGPSPSCSSCCSGSRWPRRARSPGRCWCSRCWCFLRRRRRHLRPSARRPRVVRGDRGRGDVGRTALAYYLPYPTGVHHQSVVRRLRRGASLRRSASGVPAEGRRRARGGGGMTGSLHVAGSIALHVRSSVHALRVPGRHGGRRDAAAWSGTSSCCEGRCSRGTRSATSRSPAPSRRSRWASTCASGCSRRPWPSRWGWGCSGGAGAPTTS